MSNVFKYTLNDGYYYDSWIRKNENVEKTNISTNLKNCFNEALQHYNDVKYTSGIAKFEADTLDEEVTTFESQVRAILKEHKYWGFAPTIDWSCTGFSLLNGLEKVEIASGNHSQILSGYVYNNTNEGINILVVDGVQDFFRFGTGNFSSPEIYEEYMSKRCMFSSGGEIVFHVELEPIYNSQWFTGSGFHYANYNLETDEYYNPLTPDKVKEKCLQSPENYLVLKNFWAYAKLNDTLPRVPINKTSLNKNKETTPYVEFKDKFNNNLYVPVWGMLLDGCCPNYGDISLFNNNTPKLLFSPYLHKYGYFKEPPFLKVEGGVTTPNHHLLDGHRTSFVVGTEAEFKKFFNDLGLKVTYIKDEALNVPIEEWTDVPVEPPVEPENPDFPDITDPELPDTPERPTDGHANGNGGQEGGDIDNEIKPPISPDSDLQEEGVNTGVKYSSVSWALNEQEVTDLNFAFLSGDLWTNIPSWFSNPQQAILSLIKFPFSLPNVSADYINQEDQLVIIANVPMETPDLQVTGRIMHHKFKTRIKICEFHIKRFFNSYLDYEPYTKIKLYMPYVGNIDLPVDYVMDKKIELIYDINYIDGSVLAIVKLTSEYGGHIILSSSGTIGINIPVAKSDIQDNIMSSMKSIASLGLSVAASGATGGVGSALMTGVQGATSTAISSVRQSTVTMDRPSANHTRALSSSPYLIYERPITNMPKNYTQIRGIATNIYKPLKELAGFTICKNVKLDNLTRALSSEVDEIRSLLESGVILGKPKKG